MAARPLGEELGVHLTESPTLQWVERTLAGDGQPIELAGLALLCLGTLTFVEGAGLWRGWRWAEYLTVVATALFGVRGGYAAYRRDVRQRTLPGELLQGLGRSPDELRGDPVV